MSNPQSTTTLPDPGTLERIKHLSIVGNALFQTESEATFETNFFLAKEALIKFKEGVDQLKLTPEMRTGMDNLYKYLQTKIDKRLRKTTDENMWMT